MLIAGFTVNNTNVANSGRKMRRDIHLEIKGLQNLDHISYIFDYRLYTERRSASETAIDFGFFFVILTLFRLGGGGKLAHCSVFPLQLRNRSTSLNTDVSLLPW